MDYTEPPPEMDTPKAHHLRRMREQYGVGSPEARAAFDERLAEVLDEEDAAPEDGLWFLSFADPDLPEGTQYLGGAVIRAHGQIAAITLASIYGANPGGEVLAIGPLPLDAIDEQWQNRPLTKDEVASIPPPSFWF